jgi:hypothetical protein
VSASPESERPHTSSINATMKHNETLVTGPLPPLRLFTPFHQCSLQIVRKEGMLACQVGGRHDVHNSIDFPLIVIPVLFQRTENCGHSTHVLSLASLIHLFNPGLLVISQQKKIPLGTLHRRWGRSLIASPGPTCSCSPPISHIFALQSTETIGEKNLWRLLTLLRLANLPKHEHLYPPCTCEYFRDHKEREGRSSGASDSTWVLSPIFSC